MRHPATPADTGPGQDAFGGSESRRSVPPQSGSRAGIALSRVVQGSGPRHAVNSVANRSELWLRRWIVGLSRAVHRVMWWTGRTG